MCCRCCLRQVCVHCALCACACVCVGVYTRACSLVECLLTRAAHPHRITYVLHQMLPHAQRQAQAHTFACKHTHTHSLIRTYSLSARASFPLSLSLTHTHTHTITHTCIFTNSYICLSPCRGGCACIRCRGSECSHACVQAKQGGFAMAASCFACIC